VKAMKVVKMVVKMVVVEVVLVVVLQRQKRERGGSTASVNVVIAEERSMG
jgi:hypothetical protein